MISNATLVSTPATTINEAVAEYIRATPLVAVAKDGRIVNCNSDTSRDSLCQTVASSPMKPTSSAAPAALHVQVFLLLLLAVAVP